MFQEMMVANSGGGGEEEIKAVLETTISANAVPSFTVDGLAKKVYAYQYNGGSGQNSYCLYTNVNPTTDEVDNDHLYATSNGTTWADYTTATGNKLSVSNNSVAFTVKWSSYSCKAMLIYTV